MTLKIGKCYYREQSLSCLIRHWEYPVEKQETDQHGKAGFLAQPIGYMDKNGNFCPYDYLVRERQKQHQDICFLKK